MTPQTASRDRRPPASFGAMSRVLPLLMIVAGSAAACAPALSVADARAHVRSTVEATTGVRRWPAGTLLVRVEGLSRTDSAAVFRAFGAWLEGSAAPLSVRAAGPGEVAQVEVRGVDRIERGVDPTGMTELDWTGASLAHARIELARYGRRGVRVTSLERRRAIVHEVGHALGLAHSARFTSIMHRRTPGRDVDATDRLALRVLYAVPLTAPVAAAMAGPDEDDDL